MTSRSQKAETFSVTVQQATTSLAIVALQVGVQEGLISVRNIPREILLQQKDRGVQPPQRFTHQLSTLRSTAKDEGRHPRAPQEHPTIVATPHAGVPREVQHRGSRAELSGASHVPPSIGVSSLQESKGLQKQMIETTSFLPQNTLHQINSFFS
jgi:hypothetical protein